MKKNLKFFPLIFVVISVVQAEFRQDAILFCLKPDIQPLQINPKDAKTEKHHPELQQLFSTLDGLNLDRWLKSAGPDDHRGDIFLNRIYRLTFTPNPQRNIQTVKSELENIPIILSAKFESIKKPYYTPNDPQYGQQWFLPQINANDAWNFWNINAGEIPGNKQVLLASVDTGVDWDHTDLGHNIWNNLGEDANGNGVTIVQNGNSWEFDPGDLNDVDDDGNGFTDDLIGWDLAGFGGALPDNNPNPPSGVSSTGTWAHGTHVAGLLSATTDNSTGISSVGFNCSIMAVKVSTGDQSYPYITHGYDGILYAAKAGFYNDNFTIINNSWGGGGYNEYEQITIDIVHDDYGAVIFAAGGNGNENTWNEEYSSHYPSSYEHVISVCPLGTGDNWSHWATYHESIDLASPGENIRSTRINNGYATWTGSSMASPIAAGTIGLLRSYNMNWTNEMLETMILATADPVNYEVNTEGYLQGMLGYGRVDALKAISTPLFPKFDLAGIDIFLPNDPSGVISPGDYIELMVILFNNEDWGTAVDLSGTLITEEEELSISNESVEFDNIPPGVPALNAGSPFTIEVSPAAESGDYILNLQLISNVDDYVHYSENFEIILTIEGEPFLLGDVDFNGNIDILDVVNTANFVLGNAIPTTDQAIAADVNTDGFIDILDIVGIVNIILGN